MKKKLAIVAAVLLGAFGLYGHNLLAQNASGPGLQKSDKMGRIVFRADESRLPSNQDIQSLKKSLRSQKKQIVAANMTLTDAEAERFWPVYDRYAEDLDKITDERIGVITEYAQEHDAMTDEQAKDYLQRRGAVEQSLLELRAKYIPIFGKVLSGKETALFFQIEWQLNILTDMELAQMPPVDYQ